LNVGRNGHCDFFYNLCPTNLAQAFQDDQRVSEHREVLEKQHHLAGHNISRNPVDIQIERHWNTTAAASP
jgi:hypothetical protein